MSPKLRNKKPIKTIIPLYGQVRNSNMAPIPSIKKVKNPRM
jgi:hypothetical protein